MDKILMTDCKKCDLCKKIYINYQCNTSDRDYDGTLTFMKLCGTKTVLNLDICDDCFSPLYDKLIPMLEKMGWNDDE